MQYCLCALVLIMPLLTLWAYRLGAGQAQERPPLPRFSVTKKRETSQEALIARNIENYNGTAKGQVEIK